MLAVRALAMLAMLPLVSAAPAPTVTCAAPVSVPSTVTTPNATYYTDVEPPKRYSGTPKGSFQIAFGQDAIDEFCGRPPCGMRFLGCSRGNRLALPDPFTTDSETFARIARHEFGHLNGWPATHGD